MKTNKYIVKRNNYTNIFMLYNIAVASLGHENSGVLRHSAEVLRSEYRSRSHLHGIRLAYAEVFQVALWVSALGCLEVFVQTVASDRVHVPRCERFWLGVARCYHGLSLFCLNFALVVIQKISENLENCLVLVPKTYSP